MFGFFLTLAAIANMNIAQNLMVADEFLPLLSEQDCVLIEQCLNDEGCRHNAFVWFPNFAGLFLDHRPQLNVDAVTTHIKHVRARRAKSKL
jgi:hypothetical protein